MEEILKQDVNLSPSQSSLPVESTYQSSRLPDLSLIEILIQLARRKQLIGTVTGASFLIGVMLSFVLPASYTAVTKIMPPRQTQSSASLFNRLIGIGALANLGRDGGFFKDPNAMYIGLLQSESIEDSIIDKFGLRAAYHARDLSIARKKLQSNTNIASEGSTLIAISVTDHNRNRAADIANAYVDDLRILNQSISLTEASRRRAFFEDQLNAQKNALAAAEVAFRNVEQSNGLIRLDTQTYMIVSRLARLQGQIAAKEAELQALRSYSTEQNPLVQLAESKLSAMKEEAVQLERQSGSSDFSDLGLKDIPKAGLDYTRAQRDLLYHQTLFELLLKQYEAARLDEAKDAVVIQVVEPAVVPDRRSAPNRGMIVILCTFLGLTTGCILALLSYWRDLLLSDPEGAAAYRRLKYALAGKTALEA